MTISPLDATIPVFKGSVADITSTVEGMVVAGPSFLVLSVCRHPEVGRQLDSHLEFTRLDFYVLNSSIFTPDDLLSLR